MRKSYEDVRPSCQVVELVVARDGGGCTMVAAHMHVTNATIKQPRNTLLKCTLHPSMMEWDMDVLIVDIKQLGKVL